MFGFLDGRQDGWMSRLGMRRRKPLADRVQDVAEQAVESVQDAYESVVTTMTPWASRSRKTIYLAGDRLRPLIRRSGRAAFKTGDRARGTYESALVTVKPALERSGEAANKALARTADATTTGLQTAAGVVTAVTATGAAVVGGVGAFFAALSSWMWWLVVTAFKTAILLGVAYAGWQWLQSRRVDRHGQQGEQASYSSTYGTVAPAETRTAVGAR